MTGVREAEKRPTRVWGAGEVPASAVPDRRSLAGPGQATKAWVASRAAPPPPGHAPGGAPWRRWRPHRIAPRDHPQHPVEAEVRATDPRAGPQPRSSGRRFPRSAGSGTWHLARWHPRSPLPAPRSLLPAPCSPLPAPCSPLPAAAPDLRPRRPGRAAACGATLPACFATPGPRWTAATCVEQTPPAGDARPDGPPLPLRGPAPTRPDGPRRPACMPACRHAPPE